MTNHLAQTFVAIAVILIVARLVGLLFLRIRQPVVIGEIVGGIILGPTILGVSAGNTLFPTSVRPSLALIGQLGLALYMFMVGLRLNVKTVRTNPRMVSLISLGSLILPFALAMPLAAFLYTHHKIVGGHAVNTTAFFLFVGTSLSITAFPVLARILEARRMQNTELGAIATACAAIQDVAGWILLAIILAIASSHGAFGSLVRIALESLACVAGIFAVAQILGWLEQGAPGAPSRFTELVRSSSATGSVLLPATVVLVLLCAATTQAIGLHAIFGAFLLGAVLRGRLSDGARERVSQRLAPITAGVLLPIYFITPGLSVNLRTIDSHGIAEIALILLAACAGKIGGAYLAGRASGLSGRQSAVMGSLMNTRGLIELVVLQVALAAGIVDKKLFSELVFMAVVTTMMTQPLLSYFMRASGERETEHTTLMALNAR